MDLAGNLFASTQIAGAHQSGAIIELSPKNRSTFKERIIYSFCSQQSCADGVFPIAPLVQDGAGNLLGTTAGGSGSNQPGTIFKLSPGKKAYTLTTLHTFCLQTDCPDGQDPVGQLALDFKRKYLWNNRLRRQSG